jgi:histidinol dehydrogenase
MKVYNFKNGKKIDIKDLLKGRETNSFKEYEDIVFEVVQNVKTNQDQALLEYTEKFDKVKLTQETIKVTKEEIQKAYEQVDDKLIDVMKKASERIYAYHMMQKKYSWFDTTEDGALLGQKVTPLESAGAYVPGGKAVYPSSLLMNVIPAKVAGVKKVVVTTPPVAELGGVINPLTLVAADIAKVDEIYKVGGAQAIAALAYGTETIPKVDAIVGPGNIFVALAKKQVYGQVRIDSIAGPSEVLVIADASANPKFVAADLLSQAEHDEMASAVLVTNDAELATQVEAELIRQTQILARQEIIQKSLDHYGVIIIVDTIKEAIDISNDIAPEHLEVCIQDPFSMLPFIKNAGAIFLGNYSPEPLGDYMAGPNHVLPTNGTSKFFSPLSVDDFIKKSSIISFNETALSDLKEDIMAFASSEQLSAHANSIKVRFEND